MHIAVNGSLVSDHPSIPSSLHLIEWLSLLQGTGFQVTLLHPGAEQPPIPQGIGTIAVHRGEGRMGRLRFEQRALPNAAGDLHADLLIVGEGQAPLASPTPIATISSLDRGFQRSGMVDTLAYAAGRAGSRGASIRLSPSDTAPESGRTAYPPFVAPAFGAQAELEGEEHVLCYGFNRADVRFILSAWTYVDGSLADSYPLSFLGVGRELIGEISAIAAELDVEGSIRVWPEVSYRDLPGIYSKAAAYLGTEFAADGQALRWALTAGAPIVAPKTPPFEALLGSAAYLVPPRDSRTLGAALLTVLIQERVSNPLKKQGLEKAAEYRDPRAGEEIASILMEIVDRERGAVENDK